MVTDLRRALREAADDEPIDGPDVVALLGEGARRVRRRRWFAVGAIGAAAAAALGVVGAVAAGPMGWDRSSVPNPPADRSRWSATQELGLPDAVPTQPPVLASTRTLWLDPAHDLDYDHLDGLTADGKVARSRFTFKGEVLDVGQVDPATGRTEWLPRPPQAVSELRPLQLDSNRLIYLYGGHHWTDGILIFDLHERTWSQRVVNKPPNTDRFFGERARLGPNGRVYLLDKQYPSRLRWYSVPLAGGMPTPEPGLDGKDVAWQGVANATADLSGRVVVTANGTARVFTSAPPTGCGRPDALGPDSPSVDFAGSLLVVNFACRDGAQVVVFDGWGRPTVALEGAPLKVAAVGDRWVLLSGNGHSYALAPSRGELLDLGAELHERSAASTGDLVLWNEPGPKDNDTTYDVVYKTARMPAQITKSGHPTESGSR